MHRPVFSLGATGGALAARARSAAQVQATVIKRIETEAGAPAPSFTGADQMLQRLDANKDGSSSQQEQRAALAPRNP